jgi:hypothetical protein
MAERSVLASPSDDDTDLAIAALVAATTVRLNDETVTVDQREVGRRDWPLMTVSALVVRNGIVSFW